MFKHTRERLKAYIKNHGVDAQALKASIAASGTGLAVVSTNSHAALNAGVATGLTDLTADFNSLLTLAYPVMITITVALVIFGMVKSFIHKAAGK